MGLEEITDEARRMHMGAIESALKAHFCAQTLSLGDYCLSGIRYVTPAGTFYAQGGRIFLFAAIRGVTSITRRMDEPDTPERLAELIAEEAA